MPSGHVVDPDILKALIQSDAALVLAQAEIDALKARAPDGGLVVYRNRRP